MDAKFVKGIVTDLGGRTSHAAIMSRTLRIPAVVGSENITTVAKDGQTIIVDGLDGDVGDIPGGGDRAAAVGGGGAGDPDGHECQRRDGQLSHDGGFSGAGYRGKL